MRFQLSIEIDVPRDLVVALFLDPDNLQEWQPDLVHFEMLDGATERAVGVKSRQIHKSGSQEVEMIETITIHDPPESFAAIYEADGIWNLVANRFLDHEGRKTIWILDFEFKCEIQAGSSSQVIHFNFIDVRSVIRP